jgi:glycosyltransferase involved in cell wall biosynthesis
MSGTASPAAAISAVIPCYQCKGTIRRAVSSVANQSLRPAELILVEDASRDGTLELLEQLRREFGEPWVKIIVQGQNMGPASARNTGWDAASGKYVAFLDADDAWHPRKLEVQREFLEAHPDVALCGHAYRRLNEGERGDDERLDVGHARTITFGMLLLSNRFVTPSAMVRREVPLRFLAGRRYMEDHLLWLEIAASGRAVVCLDRRLVFTFKAATGSAGLSARTWEMRKGEIANFWHLRRERRIGAAAAAALTGYSLVKHCARSVLRTLGI